MSVLVSTQFSQGRVFYAGETVTCTITFSNPLPILPVPPTTSSSASSYRRRGSIRNSASYPSRLQAPITTSHSSSPLARTNKQFNGQHSRSQSLTSASDFASRKDADTAAKSPSSHRRTGSTAIGHAVYEESQSTPNRKTSSFTDLASSTFAYFTGFSINGSQETRNNGGDESEKEVTEKNDIQSQEDKQDLPSEREDDQSSELSHPIAIELGSIEPDTPRSSIDTQNMYIPREPDSRRSSIDSTASYATNSQSSNHLGAHRFNFMMKSTSTPSLLHKSEHLLWGFAQVVGHFVADPTMINASEFSQLKTRTMYRPGGGFGGGGGMLGRPSGTRSQSKIDTNSIPVFSTPPSILFVDLNLLPGESKSYLYKLTLPKDIPPSHKGRCIRFNYHLVIGTQRSSSNNSSSTTTGMGRGHVVHLPFRVLNHVSQDGSRPIYDLMNPVVTYQDEAKVELVDANAVSSKPLPLPVKQTVEETIKNRKDFLSYVEELIASSSLSTSKRQNSTDSSTSTSTLASPPPNSEITRRVSEVYEEESEQTKGEPKRSSYINKDGIIEYTPDKNCAQLVSDIVRAGHKAMYDICKSNVRVAYLHLAKTMQRLGEPIMGVLNFKGCDIPTYHINITLESHEEIEQSIALKSQQQTKKITRRIHSEHHEFCLNTRRVAFSLPVPVTATPDFQTTGVKLQYFLRLEFLTGIQRTVIPDASTPDHIEKENVPSYLPINVDGRHKHYQAAQEVDVSSFDCTIPLKIYGASGGIDKGIYGWSTSFVVTE